MAKGERYEVVSGTRQAPGAVLATFLGGIYYQCGGPATAALRWFTARCDKPGAVPMFCRRVVA